MCFSKSSLKLILKMVLQLRRAKKGPRISLYKYEIFGTARAPLAFQQLNLKKIHDSFKLVQVQLRSHAYTQGHSLLSTAQHFQPPWG
jgi:hypothetical protein